MDITLKHTPAPWKVNEKGQIISSRGDVIASCVYGRDAHVIAAAPDLLEALEIMTSLFVDDYSPRENYESVIKARAAIAKAEGK